MLGAGIITSTVFAWFFPVAIASEQNGTPKVCVAYRTSNKKMKPDKWHLPRIEEVIDNLGYASLFTILDSFCGFRQINLAENIKEKTRFICNYGTYQFEVIPFGLMNAPFRFQRIMDSLFAAVPFLGAYLNDIVVFSDMSEDHVHHLDHVLPLVSNIASSSRFRNVWHSGSSLCLDTTTTVTAWELTLKNCRDTEDINTSNRNQKWEAFLDWRDTTEDSSKGLREYPPPYTP